MALVSASLTVGKRYEQVRNFLRDWHVIAHDEEAEFNHGGTVYRITDIMMRMLTPRELYTAQGFPASYIIDRRADGRPLTKTAQVRMCGNSVPPQLVAALVRANGPETWNITPAPEIPLLVAACAAGWK